MFGHPKGLFVLFFTELWERFSFYGMKAILVLYLVAETSNGGLGWTDVRALSLYGTYSMLVYLGSLPGGIIADRWLGQRKAVMLGGVLLCIGHLLMGIKDQSVFYVALTFIVLGVSFLKPNISTMVGGLYAEGDARRDSAFTVFYMGINIGALISPVLCGLVAEKIGWHYGFMLAGLGMIVGQCVYLWGQKYLGEEGLIVKKPAGNTDVQSCSVCQEFMQGVREFFALFKLSRVEFRRILAILISFLVVCVFWGAYEQAGGYLNLYAEQYTNRFLFGWEIPASWFQSLNPVYIILFAPLLAVLWQWLGKKKKDPSDVFKMGLGTAIMAIGFFVMIGASIERVTGGTGKASMVWLTIAIFFHTIGELALSPVSLSYVTKISPKRLVSTMMGLYFAVTGVAEKIAGWVGEFAVNFGDRKMFTWVAVVSLIVGIILMIVTKPLRKLTHEGEPVT